MSRIDAATNTVSATIAVTSGGLYKLPVGVAVDGDSVWVTNSSEGTVSRIDAATNTVSETINAGPGGDPISGAHLGVAADGGTVWVTNYADGTVSRIEP